MERLRFMRTTSTAPTHMWFSIQETASGRIQTNGGTMSDEHVEAELPFPHIFIFALLIPWILLLQADQSGRSFSDGIMDAKSTSVSFQNNDSLQLSTWSNCERINQQLGM